MAIACTMQEDWDSADDWRRLAEQEIRRLELDADRAQLGKPDAGWH